MATIKLLSGKEVKGVTINNYIKSDGEQYSVAQKGHTLYCIAERTAENNLWKRMASVPKRYAISFSDFDFTPAGYGHYRVTYTSPATSNKWALTTDNMPLIDLTKNAEQPLKKHLEELKSLIKTRGRKL